MKPHPSTPSDKRSRNDQGKIAETAYRLFVQRGCQDGHDVDDWLEAERQVASSLSDDREIPPMSRRASAQTHVMPKDLDSSPNDRARIRQQSTPFRTAARSEHLERSE